MRIAFVATRLAGVDGVSLEVAKIADVLTRLGHEVFYCAGELEPGGPPGRLIPEMHFHHPSIQDVQRDAFSGTEPSAALDAEIQRLADDLRPALRAFVDDFAIDALCVHNAFCIPMHLPLGVALADLVEEMSIPTLAHNHDFYWERERFLVNRVPHILKRAFPPVLPSVRQIAINTVMQRELWARSGVEVTVIPNVFDFETLPPPPDGYSNGFRADMGFAPDDVILLQPTRLIARKGMERAIDLVAMLGDDRVYRYVVTGEPSDEPGPYADWLREYAERAGIHVHWIGDRIAAQRGGRDGQRIYALWDVYPQADIITYLSRYEGFGNALLETLYFRKPLIVNRYLPYRSDIGPAGVQAIEIDEYVTADTARAVKALLAEPAAVERMVEHNYRVGLEHFSYRALERGYGGLLGAIEAERAAGT
ncbi:MAG: glycosyltransferase family 4 protein [Chloroflexi bacterium]|nr:glycosyltransferase family 4 protein [Chloroflexota bacterium]